MHDLWKRLAVQYCRWFHREVMQPVRGHYLCRTCRRAYPVPWREGEDYLRRVKAAGQWAVTDRGFEVFELQKNQG